MMDESTMEQLGEFLSSLNLGTPAVRVMAPVFDLFKDHTFAPNLATWMAIFAGVLIAWFLGRRIAPAWFSIRRRVRMLRRIPGPQEFSERFDEIDAAMRRSSFLRHPWNEFSETLLPVQDGAPRPIQNTVRPSEFFNLAEADHAGLRLRPFHAWGNVFVGVGLLFTFFGLVAALYFAAGAIREASGTQGATEAMQQALVQLLNTATFKFWTSIAGLGSSIVLGLVYRRGARLVEGALEALCRELERCTVAATAESIAAQQRDILLEQNAQFREFTGQLAFNLGKALEGALERALPPLMSSALAPLSQSVGQEIEAALKRAMPPVMTEAMGPISGHLEGMTRNIEQMNETAFRTMKEEIGSVITSSAGQEIRAVADTLSGIQGTLASASARVEGSSAAMERGIADAAGELRQVVGTMAESIANLTRGVEDGVGRSRQDFDEQLRNAIDGLSALATSVKETLADVGAGVRASSSDAAAAFSTQIADAVGRIEASSAKSAAAMEEAVAKLRDMASQASGEIGGQTELAVEALRSAADRIASSLEDAGRKMGEQSSESAAGFAERILGAAEAMQESAQRNATLIADAVARITEAADVARSGVGQAASSVGETLQRQGEAAADRVVAGATKIVDDLDDAIGGLAEDLEGLQATLKAVEKGIAGQAAAMDGVVRQTREAERSMATTAGALKDAAVPIGKATESIAQSGQQIGQAVDRAATSIAQSQKQGEALAAALTGTLDKLRGVWEQHERRFGDLDASLAKTLSQIFDNLNANAQALRDHVSKIDAGLSATVDLLAGNVEELEKSAGEFNKATASLERTVRAASEMAAG